VLIINGFVKFCGCIKIKLRREVIYAIFKFVLLIKNINNIPLKKNSSVKDSTKLTTPSGKFGLKVPPIIYLAKNVTNNINGRKRNPSFRNDIC
jgi:hypothetical protein